MSCPNDRLDPRPEVSSQPLREVALPGSGVKRMNRSLVVVTGLATAAAIFFAGVASESRARSAKSSGDPSLDWQNLPIASATAAARNENYSIATGQVSELTEGLFVLDHNSGLLQCSVIYPRMARFLGLFTVNVADALGAAAKGGNYLMVTGTADFTRASNRPMASSVVYVLDTASGNYACYGIPFDRVQMNANRPQQGVLFLISQGTANPVIDRDDLR